MFSSWLTEPELPQLLHSELPTAHDGEKQRLREEEEEGREEGMGRNVEKERGNIKRERREREDSSGVKR